MSDTKSIHDVVREIQQNIKAPKSERNDYAGFDYRNIEKINESLKRHLKSHSVRVHYTDEMVNLGDRYYVKATVTITDGNDSISAVGWARETKEKTKQDEAQLTGGASSYARKYAIQGLLALDDGSHDPDSKDNTKSQGLADNLSKSTNAPKASPNKLASVKQKQLIRDLYVQSGGDVELLNDYIEKEGYDSEKMTSADASVLIDNLMKGQG